MPASLYLALAYLKPKRSVLSVVNVLAVMGTMLAVATLLVVMSVMNGFDVMWREKFLSFYPHVMVYSWMEELDEDDPLMEQIAAMPSVERVAPFIENLVVAQNGERIHTPVIRGIDPERDFLYSKLKADEANTLVAGRFDLDDEECLIGRDLAMKLGLRVGDILTAFSPATFAREQEIVLPEELRVAGIFQVGMWQIDQGFVVCNLDTARDVIAMDDGVNGLQVLGQDLLKARDLAGKIRDMAGDQYYTMTWMQMNQQLFNALLVEKSMMFFILSMIVVVSSFLVANTLIMISMQKTREIGLLKSFGYRANTIMLTFTWYGLIQGVLGLLAGLGLGGLILHFRNNILETMSRLAGFEILPPELYFLSNLPAETDPLDVGIIVTLVLVLSLLCSSVPAFLASRKDPVEALRDG